MKKILDDLRRDLAENADEKARISGQRFFKEEVKLLGVKTALISKISRNHFKEIADKEKSQIFHLCEELFRSGIMEESFIACNWSYFVHRKYEASDFMVFEKWVNEFVNNWATCDTLCNHTVGTLIEMYPDNLKKLQKWAHSGNRWVKRASAVSLIVPARKGLFLNDVLGISDILLSDSDDMVQKGYGWLLKVSVSKHLQEVYEYVIRNKSSMPRTALRYAIEKMPADMKAEAMKR